MAKVTYILLIEKNGGISLQTLISKSANAKEVLLIHGTKALPNPAKRHWPSKFISYLEEVFGTTPQSLEWSGNVHKKARAAAARDVFDYAVTLYKTNPSAQLCIIGYSHGGNIAIEAINRLANETNFPIDKQITLITIATPIRPIYQLNTNVCLHVNAYNHLDFMQLFGQLGEGTTVRDLGIRHFKGAENRIAKRYVGHLFMHSNERFWKSHIEEYLM